VTLPARLEDFGLPGRRQEDWRWTDLSAIDAALGARANDVVPDHRHWLIDGVAGPVLLFVDGRYFAAGSDPQHVHIETCGGDEAHPLSRLTRGAVGATLRLGAEHATTGPIQIIHIATGGPAQLHHRFHLAEDAQASVIETYVGAPASWTNVAVDIDLAHSARLMRTVRRLGTGGVHT
jgi:Fe-S cluster assembly protein SufD